MQKWLKCPPFVLFLALFDPPMNLERKTNHIHVDSKCAILFLLTQWPTFSETGQHTAKAKWSQHAVFALFLALLAPPMWCVHMVRVFSFCWKMNWSTVCFKTCTVFFRTRSIQNSLILGWIETKVGRSSSQTCDSLELQVGQTISFWSSPATSQLFQKCMHEETFIARFFQKFVTHNKMKQWTHILVVIKVRQLLTTLFWAWACSTGLHSCCLGDDLHQWMWKQCQQCIDCTFLMWVCSPFPMRAKAARSRKSVEKAQMQGSKLWSAETKNGKNDTISTKLWENITSLTKTWPKCKGRTILWTAKILHSSSCLQTHAPSLHSSSNIQWQSEAVKWLDVEESNSCKFPQISLWNVSFGLVDLQQKIEVPLHHCFDVEVGFG